MHTREENLIFDLTDIPGAASPNGYSSSRLFIEDMAPKFARHTLSSNQNNINFFNTAPSTKRELGRCIVIIEQFKQFHRIKDTPEEMNRGLARLENASSEWKGFIRHYDKLKERVLKNDPYLDVLTFLEKAKEDGVNYPLEKAGEDNSFQDHFPHTQLSSHDLESHLYEIERLFELDVAETKAEHKSEFKQVSGLSSSDYEGEVKTVATSIAPSDLDQGGKEAADTSPQYFIAQFCENLGKAEADSFYEAIVRFFQNHGNPHVVNKQGRNLLQQLVETPIQIEHSLYTRQIASMRKMMGLLFDNGVDFNAKDLAGNTALHITIAAGNGIGVIDWLHYFGCGINIANTKAMDSDAPQTPLDQVFKKYHSMRNYHATQLIAELKKLGAKTWKETIGAIASFGGIFLSNKDATLAQYRVELDARENFSYTKFLEICRFLDFSKKIQGKTRLDFYKERGILADALGCNLIKAAAQSSMPFKAMHAYLIAAEDINKKKKEKDLLEQKEAEENAAKEENAREDKKITQTRLKLFKCQNMEDMAPDKKALHIIGSQCRRSHNEELRYPSIKMAMDVLVQSEPDKEKKLETIIQEVRHLLKDRLNDVGSHCLDIFSRYMDKYAEDAKKSAPVSQPR